MSILINILLVIHVLVSLLIIQLVLMQRPKNEGLGAAFGGGMTDNLFGAQTTNVLHGATRWLGGMFFGFTLLLSFLYVRQTTASSSLQKSLTAPVAPAPATPAPVADAKLIPGTPEPASAPVSVPLTEGETKPDAPAPTPEAPKPAPTDPPASPDPKPAESAK